jgi:Helix-turn-helix domain
MSQVWEDARIQSQPELLLLLALADHARDDGVCWPSIRTIAAKARVEERSAQRIIRRLIEKGLVEIVTKGGCIDGHNVPNRYKVKGGDPALPHGPTEGHQGATSGQGVGGDRQSPRGDPKNPDGVTLGRGNHKIEPSLSKTTTTTTYRQLDGQNRHGSEAPEESPSSRRFFAGEDPPESRDQRSRASEPLNVSALIDQLARECGLSQRQRKVVSEYCDSRSEEYVREKAEIVRAQARSNAAGALMAALRDDWQPPVSTKGKTNAAHKTPPRAGDRNIGNSNEYCDTSQYKSRN